MHLTENPILGCTPAGEQKQGHVNAKRLLKQGQNTRSRAKPAGSYRSAQTLARLLAESLKQLIEAEIQQGLRGGHPTDLIKTELQTAFCQSQTLSQLLHRNRLREMEREVGQGRCHNLHRRTRPR